MKTTIFLLLTGLITFFPHPAKAQEDGEVFSININKACAKVAGIPYASDGFSDEEWGKFQNCREFMKQFIQND